MKYAVIKTQGQQFIVSEGDEILVNKLSNPDSFEAEVLLTVDGEKVEMGDPVLKKVKLTHKVLDNEKGEKIHVFKYKSKSRYRRKIGSRPEFTKIKVEKLS